MMKRIKHKRLVMVVAGSVFLCCCVLLFAVAVLALTRVCESTPCMAATCALGMCGIVAGMTIQGVLEEMQL